MIELWRSRKGKFCIIDYQTPAGIKTAIGKLVDIIDEKLILKNLSNEEEYDVDIENIENSKVKEIRGETDE